ncbi:MAG: pyridoxamine 5'-phosphate oxidase family protein [Eubacteriales bacterium]|nr:pyridoxamine 5'-phosphate oxidase family protein [Eubacteriales bacterium]
MRLKKLERDAAFAEEVLKTAPYATLAMINKDGRPYCVPINTVWYDGALYFHCAGEGEKWEILKNDTPVCLTAVTNAHVMPAHYDTAYDCAMVKGRAVVVKNEVERHAAMRRIVAALAPEHLDKLDEHMIRCMDATKIVKIVPEEITGKQNMDQ